MYLAETEKRIELLSLEKVVRSETFRCSRRTEHIPSPQESTTPTSPSRRPVARFGAPATFPSARTTATKSTTAAEAAVEAASRVAAAAAANRNEGQQWNVSLVFL